LDSLENGHMIIDTNFIITYWNRWLSINTQINKEDAIGKSLKELYPELNYSVLLRKIKTALQLGTPSFYDANSSTKFIPINRNKVTTSSLKLMQQQVTITPYIVEQSRVMISIYDISELYETKLSLQKEVESVKHLNRVLEFDQDVIDKNIMIMKSSPSGIITSVSSRFCQFFEYEKEFLIGKKASILKSGKIPESIYKGMWSKLNNKHIWAGEIENRDANGQDKWVQSRITPILGDNGDIIEFNAVYQDITNEKLLQQLYITDPLTKLYNRAYFDGLMSDISKHQRKADTDFILAITDIDHFKSINDNYGHQVGDEVLKKSAQIMKNSLRIKDVVARWGGEEFVIMLNRATIEEATNIIEKLRVKIEQTTIQDSIKITCSFGLTKYILGEDTHNTFKRVDDALYEAKNSGRNRSVIK
ncbi:MAG: diguanylate cyclase, partial [Campylobacterota bacterium]|nr:diguanylate cyclase [Campylobacterota bacterium]